MSKRTHFTGFKEAREALQELSRTVQRNVGKRALKHAAEVIADRWRGVAPVSTRGSNPTPGSLRASIKVVGERAQKGRPRIAVLVDDIAAAPYEFGRVNQPARPTFRPAADAAREQAARVFGAALTPEIEAAAKRAAAKGAKR